jgi:hypothetical protein
LHEEEEQKSLHKICSESALMLGEDPPYHEEKEQKNLHKTSLLCTVNPCSRLLLQGIRAYVEEVSPLHEEEEQKSLQNIITAWNPRLFGRLVGGDISGFVSLGVHEVLPALICVVAALANHRVRHLANKP